ncbi:TonB-dependent receptor [Aliidiomarina soli]|uniref:TonB-dependent receptor n=1 Tax=Aliidiomarina soli TaxID=1928574 RepID=A0A432WFF3_9GAMM|nr:TonB-dependent receptor [Aliidiomarina soli]RUO32449.1 TonB-dependent receptor [Aliidiomarina soli]
MFKKNLLATSIMLALAPGLVLAQEQVEEEEQAQTQAEMDEVIVVRGTRSSMSEALSRKRESIQLVDSIVAEDIGKLPNNNVVEALQHVAGVQVGTRTAGESADILIRGLGQVVTTINGRNAFTAAGRSFALADIPATMVAGLDVYKTVSAEMAEGGIGGVIDVRTRRPFDFEGSHVTLTGKATYSDQADQTDPNLSLLVSNRWNTSIGEFGALANLSYVETNYRDETIWTGAVFPYDDNGVRLPSTPGEVLATDDPSYSLSRDALGAVDDWGQRQRPAASFSFEWAPNNTSSYYLDVFYTGYRQESTSSFLFIGADSPQLDDYEYVGDTNVVSRVRNANPYVMTSSQGFDNSTDSYQYALGGEWNLTDRLDMRAEAAYQQSKYKSDLLILDIVRPADELIATFNNGSGTPSVELVGADMTATDNVVAGPFFDGREESEGDSTTLRADFDFHQPVGFITSWHFGSRYDLRNATSNNVQIYNALPDVMGQPIPGELDGLVGLTPGDFFSGSATYPRRWSTPSSDFMLNNQELMREYFTDYSGAPAYEPTEFFDIEEESLALYGQAQFRADIGYNVLDGVVGLRVVRTESSLKGYELIEDPDAGSVATLRDYDTNSTEVLPNLTLRYNIDSDIQLRFNASKTITRPGFGDMNPALTLRPPIAGQVQIGTGEGGNADLKPVEALNFDLGAEYYFGESSAIYATLFYRDIDNWIQPTTINETFDEVVYNVTRPTNAGSGEMNGVELGVQYFPDAVPDWLQGIGVQASYTYIDSHTENEDGEEEPMLGVSENSISAVLVYERGPFSARLSHIYRDAHLVDFNYTGNMPAGVLAQALQFTDFSTSYAVSDTFTLTFDATNIFGEKYQDYFEDPNLFNRDTRSYSKTYSVGFRYSF